MNESSFSNDYLSLCRKLGLPESLITEDMAGRMETLTDHLLETNRTFNLTAIKTKEEALVKHILDSLMPVGLLQELSGPEPSTLLDIGSGAGFPSLPLACALPSWEITAMDATMKKCRYIEETAAILSLKRVKAVNERAEEGARARSESFRFVTARAVARLNILAELSAAFLKVGGYLIAMKGPGGREELKESEKALSVLGLRADRVVEYELPDNAGQRSLIVLQKTKTTPAEYPRAYGKILKKPL